MQEFKDEKGNTVAISTDAPDATPNINEAHLRYIRPCPKRVCPAEIVIKDNDYYVTAAVSREQLENLLSDGLKLLREFDKRPIEDLEVE
jgi:hypothetical protein